MKLKVPATFKGEIRDADGKVYQPRDGAVDIPDEKVTNNLWGFGFERISPQPTKSFSSNKEV